MPKRSTQPARPPRKPARRRPAKEPAEERIEGRTKERTKQRTRQPAAKPPRPRAGESGAPPFFTIGHSTRTLDEFAALLKAAAIELVVDVRTIRRSRTNPQYNADTFPAALNSFGIGYEPLAALGGRRGRQRAIDAHTNGFWQDRKSVV